MIIQPFLLTVQYMWIEHFKCGRVKPRHPTPCFLPKVYLLPLLFHNIFCFCRKIIFILFLKTDITDL